MGITKPQAAISYKTGRQSLLWFPVAIHRFWCRWASSSIWLYSRSLLFHLRLLPALHSNGWCPILSLNSATIWKSQYLPISIHDPGWPWWSACLYLRLIQQNISISIEDVGTDSMHGWWMKMNKLRWRSMLSSQKMTSRTRKEIHPSITRKKDILKWIYL